MHCTEVFLFSACFLKNSENRNLGTQRQPGLWNSSKVNPYLTPILRLAVSLSGKRMAMHLGVEREVHQKGGSLAYPGFYLHSPAHGIQVALDQEKAYASPLLYRMEPFVEFK